MNYKELFRGGPQISAISFGAWGISGRDWGKTDDSDSIKALHKALDLGINLIDTADVYGFGHSDELIKQVLIERKREDIIVATKAGNDFYNYTDRDGNVVITPNYNKDYLKTAVENTLKRFGTDRLDLLQLHSPTSEILEASDAWDTLYELKSEGKIRWAGISIQSFKNSEQTRFVEQYNELLEVLQIRYNLLERDAEEKLIPTAEKHGIGLLARIPLLFGFLTGKFTRESTFGENDHRRMNLSREKLDQYFKQIEKFEPVFNEYREFSKAQIALAFIIKNPNISAAIPGGKNPKQVEDNCKAVDVPDGAIEKLQEIIASE